MSHWTDETNNWLEIFKRKLSVTHKDLYSYLDKIVEESTLEFIDLQACALSAARAVGYYPVFTLAIEKDMGIAEEKNAAIRGSAMASLNSSWVYYLESINEDKNFFDNMPDILEPYGGTTEVKFNMYLLSAYIVYGNKLEIKRCVDFLKNNISEDQIKDIVRIAAIIQAAIKTQT